MRTVPGVLQQWYCCGTQTRIETFSLHTPAGVSLAVDSGRIALGSDRLHRYRNQNLVQQYINVEDRTENIVRTWVEHFMVWGQMETRATFLKFYGKILDSVEGPYLVTVANCTFPDS